MAWRYLSELTAMFLSLEPMRNRLPGLARRARLVLAAATAGGMVLAACSTPVTSGTPLVTLAMAQAAVTHHWDINRQALQATSSAEARRLIEQVESGDALKLDETVIAREAADRGANPSKPPAIPGATGVRVFVPRQSAYPALFMSVRTEHQTNASGNPTGQSHEVLELFKRQSASDTWHNTGYADVAPNSMSKIGISLDRDGYATFADGAPGGADLSALYTGYISALLGGHPDQADKRIAPGVLTDQFATNLQKALGQLPDVKSTAAFAASSRQDGIKLKTSSGGRFVLFDNVYDVTSTPVGGGCVTAGPGSSIPGSFSSVTEHFLQNVGAVVASGGSVTIVAESDSSVGADTKPCTGGGAVV
jgi:hypothetical protein